MEIRSDRLVLRPLSVEDGPEMLKIRAHPEINKYIGRTPPSNLKEIKAFINKIRKATEAGMTLFWTMRRLNTKEIIGTICLWNIDRKQGKAEIGYELLPEFQGKGYMTEAIQRVLEFGFEAQGFHKIAAYTNRNNDASLRLLTKMGFEYHPEIMDKDYPDNQVYIKNVET